MYLPLVRCAVSLATMTWRMGRLRRMPVLHRHSPVSHGNELCSSHMLEPPVGTRASATARDSLQAPSGHALGARRSTRLRRIAEDAGIPRIFYRGCLTRETCRPAAAAPTQAKSVPPPPSP